MHSFGRRPKRWLRALNHEQSMLTELRWRKAEDGRQFPFVIRHFSLIIRHCREFVFVLFHVRSFVDRSLSRRDDDPPSHTKQHEQNSQCEIKPESDKKIDLPVDLVLLVSSFARP